MFEIVSNRLNQENPRRAAYVYDLDGMDRRLKFLLSNFSDHYHFHYALKANHFPEILKLIKSHGFGVDVVSGGEFEWARQSGFSGSEIVFSGIGKTAAEITNALKGKVKQINVESQPEFDRVVQISRTLGVVAKVALRVNPNVEANTHPYIRTGLRENKFGIDFETCERILASAKDHPSVEFVGTSLHIGSQIREVGPFKEAIEKTLALYQRWQNEYPSMKRIDIGGGLGMNYQSEDLIEDETLIKSYAEVVRTLLDPWLKSGKLTEVLLEPGRLIVARFGTLFAQVEYVKRTAEKNFIVVNTGMHHLMRPMLYQAYHRIDCVGRSYSPHLELFDVVGPICESTDTLGRERALPTDINEGDWIAIRDAGAYGSVMKNNYNLQLEPLEFAVRGGEIL